MATRDLPRVLLLWPGALFGTGGNFGVPQVLSIAGALAGEAVVDVVDLDMEVAFGPVDFSRYEGRYDVVGISCYSSFDYLKVMEIAARLRRALPKAWLVVGGYHASARPDDFTGPESPFDYVVVGDGERSMARLVGAFAAGKRPLVRVVGPEPVPDPQALPSYDWSLLERYRQVARNRASQAEIYLSRGCPYDCAFCMERAKRDVSWRALSPERAVEELHRLDAFLDLSSWTLFVADALFGMKKPWRRELLEQLGRRPLRARKVWLLIRLDLLEREDLELMKRANVAPGFGLETGDPDHLRTIRKAGRLTDYHEQMIRVAGWARELGVPFGANLIVGHPGETEASMRTTARYLRRVFLDDPRGTTGFVSIDPFRLYPGSPIDEERGEWEAKTGMRVHRYPWWHDGDQEFLSEWVDPSASLDYRTAHRLRHELFGPIVREVATRFSYDGPARDYFMRAVREQVDLLSPRRALHELGLHHLWTALTREEPAAESRARLRSDTDVAAFARAVREIELARAEIAHGPIRDALVAVPRERFVELEHVAESARDVPLPLGDDAGSTISAMHAYALTFEALGLTAGDALVDLGGGTGYGARVAAEVVGPTGRVLTLELAEGLSARAAEELSGLANVEVACADAHDVARWAGARKVAVGFALPALPRAWADALAASGQIVAPIGAVGQTQTLTRFTKGEDGVVRAEALGAVRYVGDRTPPR